MLMPHRYCNGPHRERGVRGEGRLTAVRLHPASAAHATYARIHDKSDSLGCLRCDDCATVGTGLVIFASRLGRFFRGRAGHKTEHDNRHECQTQIRYFMPPIRSLYWRASHGASFGAAAAWSSQSNDSHSNVKLTSERRLTANEIGQSARHSIGALIVRVGKKFQARFSYRVKGSNP